MRYFDSGVLLKLYLPEPNAVQAVALVQATGSSPVMTPLHLLEMRSAIRQKQGRNEVTSAECQPSFAHSINGKQQWLGWRD